MSGVCISKYRHFEFLPFFCVFIAINLLDIFYFSEPNTARFVKPLSADEIKARNYQAVPKKTRQSNDWALGVGREWSKYRNSQPATILEPGYLTKMEMLVLVAV